MSRSASASQRPRPRIACWRHGPGSPAASARIHPVLRRSSPSRPSRNKPAEAATRSWLNKTPIRALTSRSDDAHNSSVASIDAPDIHDLPNHGRPWIQKFDQSATVMLSPLFLLFDLAILDSSHESTISPTGTAKALTHLKDWGAAAPAGHKPSDFLPNQRACGHRW